MRWYLVSNVVVAASLCGCTGRPTGTPLTRAGFDATELIAYRALTRDDFKAPFALGYSVTEERRIGATTCSRIVVRPELATRPSGQGSYAASLANPIFFAVFSRKCSWWKPEQTNSEGFVLEHEQIHFAIIELEARRLNGRAEDIAHRVHTVGTDERGVYFRADAELQKVLATAMETVQGRNDLFDTQMVDADPVRQRVWFHKISAELEATQILARGPQLVAPVAEAPAPEPALTAPMANANISPPQVPASARAASSEPPAAAQRPVVSPMPAPAPSAPATTRSPSSTGSFPD